jgi:DNA (cytosine-5)-methyltransferase 1
MTRNYVTHFCGLGGACWGLEQAGLDCNLAVDNDGDGPAVETRAWNLKCDKGLIIDVRDYFKGYPLKPEHVKEEHRKDLFLLWTSPPCKKFSMANKGSPKDLAMENLYRASLEFAAWAKPKFVIVENVLGLLRHEAESQGIRKKTGKLTEMLQEFASIGYAVDWDVLDAWRFGLPQKRQRVFIVCTLNKRLPDELGRYNRETGILASFFPAYPQNARMLKFDDIRDYGVSDHQLGGKSYLTMMEKLWRCRNLRIKILGAPGSSALMPTVTCGFGGGITRKKCAVVDSVGTGKDHVTFLRHPTLKEGLRAQGFPDDWMLPDNDTLAWNMVGNAVPSPVSKALAEHLKSLDDWAEKGYEGSPPASKPQWHKVHRLDELTCEKKGNIVAECPWGQQVVRESAPREYLD